MENLRTPTPLDKCLTPEFTHEHRVVPWQASLGADDRLQALDVLADPLHDQFGILRWQIRNHLMQNGFGEPQVNIFDIIDHQDLKGAFEARMTDAAARTEAIRLQQEAVNNADPLRGVSFIPFEGSSMDLEFK